MRDGAWIIRLCAVLFSDLLPFFRPPLCCFRAPAWRGDERERLERQTRGELSWGKEESVATWGLVKEAGQCVLMLSKKKKKTQIFGVALLLSDAVKMISFPKKTESMIVLV